jgi:hypothetical protein
MVLWIDSNEIATALIEKVFKSQSKPFYFVTSVRDFAYLIRDLAPHLIVLEGATALSELESVKKQYEETEGFLGTPVVLLNSCPELSFIKNVRGELQSPLDPFSLPETLSKMSM